MIGAKWLKQFNAAMDDVSAVKTMGHGEVSRSTMAMVEGNRGVLGSGSMIVEETSAQREAGIGSSKVVNGNPIVVKDILSAAQNNKISNDINEEACHLVLDTKRRRTTMEDIDGAHVRGDVATGQEVNGSKNLSLVGTVIDVNGRSGGFALLWKIEDEVSLLGFSDAYIDVRVASEGVQEWRFTGVYGEPNRSRRASTWNLLRTLANRSNLPCGLQDMELCSYPFTWERGRGTNHWIKVRLDRGLANLAWLNMFTSVKLHNLEISTSDHTLILMVMVPTTGHNFVKQFRFENFCGEKLADWGKEVTGNFKERLKKCKNELQRWKLGRDEVSVANYKQPKRNLVQSYVQREVFWRQRSKKLWLQEGDNNNKYVYASATTRRRNNFVAKLKDHPGAWVDWDSGLDQLMRDVTSIVQTRVSSQKNTELLLPVSDEEVCKALFQMHPDKSQGPDDLNKTILVLIPKKKQPMDMGNLRPIALCNVLYKIVSKVVGNRLKSVMLGRDGYMALKLDVSKVYDKLEWGYLCAMMVSLVFCVVMNKVVYSRDVKLLKATEDEAYNVKDLLRTYEVASGQRINFTKSSVFYRNNTVGRNKNAILGFLKDKLRKRIQGWEGRILSRAGKEVLLKSIAQALPNYAMSVFLLPLDTCKELERLMAKFRWHSNSSSGKGIN
ncbi:hypothetical protein CsatB_008785 [Cannabis sativa]